MIRTVLKVEGMACAMCEAHINDTVRNTVPVKGVASSRKTGETVILSEQPVDAEALKRAIEAIGYRVGTVTSEPYEKRGFRLFRKSC